MTVRPQQDVLWQQRWLLLVCGVVIAGAVVVLGFQRHGSWHWGLFAVGVAIGLFGLAFIETAFAVARRRDSVRVEQNETLFRRRRIGYAIMWPYIGVLIGALSAIFDAPVIDIAAAAWILLTLGAGGVLAAVKLRRSRGSGSRA